MNKKRSYCAERPCRKNIFIGIYRFYRRLAIDISGHETKKVYRDDSHILKPSKMLVYLIYYRRNYFFMGGSVIRLLQ